MPTRPAQNTVVSGPTPWTYTHNHQPSSSICKPTAVRTVTRPLKMAHRLRSQHVVDGARYGPRAPQTADFPPPQTSVMRIAAQRRRAIEICKVVTGVRVK